MLTSVTVCVNLNLSRIVSQKMKGGDLMNCCREDIAQRLILLRGKRTREEVAKAVGISLSAMAMYENGYRIPRDETKIKLANYYGVSVEQIFFNRQ